MNTEERIATLEQRLRRQRLGMAGMGLGLAVALFLGMAQQAPKEIELEGLTITKDGKPRVVMGTNEDGGVGFGLMDGNGVVRLAMGFEAGKNDVGLAIMDTKEQARILMGDSQAGAGIMLIGAGMTELPAPKSDKD